MFDDFSLSSVTDLSAETALVVIAIMVITRKLIWHTDHEKVEKRCARMEELLWRSVGVAEATAEVLVGTAEEEKKT